MEIQIAAADHIEGGALALLVAKGKVPSGRAAELDSASGGAVEKAMKASRFTGGAGEILSILAPAGLGLTRLVLAGIGEADKIDREVLEAAGGKLAATLLCSGETRLQIELGDGEAALGAAQGADTVAAGFLLRCYRFDKYRTKEPANKKPSLETVSLACSDMEAASALFADSQAVISGVNLTRDLTSEPANVVYPATFAEHIRALEDDGIEVEILDQAALEKIGMRALLAVGQGSDNDSYVAIMRWAGSPQGADAPPVVLVGKGVTFDTGGISIKPSEGMDEMKWDMGGAGIVTGTMHTLAKRGAKANVVGIVGLVENMPSGKAQRPGDIVRSLSGQTIEVLNTDAEGRLVLADILWHAKEQFNPVAMVDFATLTGAIIVTLGRGQFAGLFSNNDKLAAELEGAGVASGDKVWRLPLTKAYDRMIDTPSADMKNIGGKGAGSITAAQFLQRFVDDVPWAHIDVAGMVWALKDGSIWEKGATGYGVRLADRWIRDNYEG